jgi:hypothetical protein
MGQVRPGVIGQPAALLRVAQRQPQTGDAPGRDGFEL